MITSSTTRWARTAALATALAAAIVPATVQAQSSITIRAQPVSAPGTFRMVVGYGDLNLATADGRAALETRVKTAARMGCNNLYSGQPAHLAWDERSACTRLSVAEATSRVERAIQLAHNGRNDAAEIALVIRR